MPQTTRVLDSVVFGEEASQGTQASTFDVDVFGDINSCTLTFDDDVRVVKGVQGGTTTGHLPSKLVDLAHKVTGQLTFQPSTLKFMKYAIAGYVEGGGNYTLANTSVSLPTSLTLRGNYDTTDGVQVTGFYLNNFRLCISDEDILTITCDIIGMKPTKHTGLVSYTVPSATPLIYAQGVFVIASRTWNLSNISMNTNPKFIAKYGITSKSAGNKRFATEIVRGGKMDITFEGAANIQDFDDEVEDVWGGTTPADQRSDVSAVLTFTDINTKTHAMTITGRTNSIDFGESDSEEDSKKMNFRGVGKNVTVIGQL
jgi:hypothetical protein